MMTTKAPPPPYEEAAELKTGISGWVCKTCRRFWGDDEHMARWCCAKDLPCECGRRREKLYTRCEDCRRKASDEKWEKWQKVPWDGETPLTTYDDDRYFFDRDELRDYCYDLGISPRDLRLILCEPQYGPTFEMLEHLCDVLPEDGDPPEGCDEIDKIVNDWIDAKGVMSWTSSSKTVTPESVVAALGWSEENDKELTDNQA